MKTIWRTVALIAIVLSALLAPVTSTFAADVTGDRIAGNLVYKDTHGKRLIDAIGPDVHKYITDCIGLPEASGELDPTYTITRVEAGAGESTFASINGTEGLCAIVTDAAEDDGISAQLLNESFKLTSTVNALYFGIRMKLSDATQSDFFAGLAITDTAILGGVTDRIGFEKLDGSTAVKFMLEKDSTETLSSSLLTADTSYHVLEFYFIGGGGVEVFVDGVSAATPATTNLPDDEDLRLSLEFLAGAAAAKTMTIDWIRVIQIGS